MTLFFKFFLPYLPNIFIMGENQLKLKIPPFREKKQVSLNICTLRI